MQHALKQNGFELYVQPIISLAGRGSPGPAAEILLRMRDEGALPRLSPMLGRLSRTNSESLLGAVAPMSGTDYSEGVAITSSFFPDPDTHVEPVRYGHGSNSMGLLQSVMTVPRPGSHGPGCRFAGRCPFAEERCRADQPFLDATGSEHYVACHRKDELGIPDFSPR